MPFWPLCGIPLARVQYSKFGQLISSKSFSVVQLFVPWTLFNGQSLDRSCCGWWNGRFRMTFVFKQSDFMTFVLIKTEWMQEFPLRHSFSRTKCRSIYTCRKVTLFFVNFIKNLKIFLYLPQMQVIFPFLYFVWFFHRIKDPGDNLEWCQ